MYVPVEVRELIHEAQDLQAAEPTPAPVITDVLRYGLFAAAFLGVGSILLSAYGALSAVLA